MLVSKDGISIQTSIVIVDSPDHEHGRMMRRCAQVDNFTPAIRWLEPSLKLPEDLMSISGVAAVAMPLGVRGATVRDRFTQRLMASIADLMIKGIPVFVAAGNRRPNLLAKAGIAVFIKDVTGSASTSEACVRAAVQIAFQSWQRSTLVK